MAVSADNFVARGDDDRMSWTGPSDKAVFKLLTIVGGERLCAGRKTYEVMPALFGREVVALSQDRQRGQDLREFAAHNPFAWLIGGQTVALEALRLKLLDEVVLVGNQTKLNRGVRLDTRISNFGRMATNFPIRIGDVDVVVLKQ